MERKKGKVLSETLHIHSYASVVNIICNFSSHFEDVEEFASGK